MPDYQKGKIYKIWSPHSDDIYIGSSTQDLAVRMGKHRIDMDCTAKNIINLGEAKIELIELYPCNSKIELNKREGYFIRSLDCVNRCIAGRTKHEYYEENKEVITAKKKQYRLDNIEQYTKKDKIYYETNKEHIAEKKKEYNEANKEIIAEKKKANYEKNKEKVAAQTKIYRENNKEIISKKMKAYREANKEQLAEKHKARRAKNCLKKKEQLAEKN